MHGAEAWSGPREGGKPPGEEAHKSRRFQNVPFPRRIFFSRKHTAADSVRGPHRKRASL